MARNIADFAEKNFASPINFAPFAIQNHNPFVLSNVEARPAYKWPIPFRDPPRKFRVIRD